MLWQDIAIMVVCYLFAVFLIPSIRSKTNKPAKSSCLLTASGLAVIGFAFDTLGLWLSFWSEIAGITAWMILFFQKRAT